jgi:cell division protein FtsL
MKNIILGILAALIVLSFYLLDKDIKEYGQIIVDQEIKISELELKVNAQKNVLLFQGARIRELEKGGRIQALPKNKVFTSL